MTALFVFYFASTRLYRQRCNFILWLTTHQQSRLFSWHLQRPTHTGDTWWGISACIVGGASFISLFAYFLVSDFYSSSAIVFRMVSSLAIADPNFWHIPFIILRRLRRLRQVCRRIQSRSRSEDFQSHVATAADAPLGEESRPARQGPSGSAAPASGTRRGSDFRQPLMHDNDEAQDMLMRSRVLFAPEHPKQQRPEAEP